MYNLDLLFIISIYAYELFKMLSDLSLLTHLRVHFNIFKWRHESPPLKSSQRIRQACPSEN